MGTDPDSGGRHVCHEIRTAVMGCPDPVPLVAHVASSVLEEGAELWGTLAGRTAGICWMGDMIGQICKCDTNTQ